jgi:hypothetical protein
MLEERITDHTNMQWLILTGFRNKCKHNTEHTENPKHCRLTSSFTQIDVYST